MCGGKLMPPHAPPTPTHPVGGLWCHMPPTHPLWGCAVQPQAAWGVGGVQGGKHQKCFGGARWHKGHPTAPPTPLVVWCGTMAPMVPTLGRHHPPAPPLCSPCPSVCSRGHPPHPTPHEKMISGHWDCACQWVLAPPHQNHTWACRKRGNTQLVALGTVLGPLAPFFIRMDIACRGG